MTSTPQAPCEILDWDTNFFGFRIARASTDTLTPESVQNLDNFCHQNQVRGLYFLSSIHDAATVRLAEANDFHLVDIRLTFEKKLSGNNQLPPEQGGDKTLIIRPSRAEDIDSLVKISENSYVDSRFYFDPHFPRHLAEALYQTWIKVSCEGWAEMVWVAELDRLPLGYITCHLDREQKTGKIGLVGVSNQAQGRGLGKELVKNASHWFAAQGMEKVTVVTQGRNLIAQRLYQRCGFITQNIQLWYHKWYLLPEK
jgi:dTDP-4-amino-4,6-dideoxy-D-galactose acyltransferase